MIREAIEKIVNKGDLSYDEAYTVMNEIMSGESTPTQNAAFLAALSTKSARAETTDEIAGCAAAMRDHATRVDTGMDIFEIVGTGGDNARSFNISTTSALVAASGGVKVAKHGNRAASSLCGTADCLEALGVNIRQSPARCIELLNEVGMCFFFAQLARPPRSMKSGTDGTGLRSSRRRTSALPAVRRKPCGAAPQRKTRKSPGAFCGERKGPNGMPC